MHFAVLDYIYMCVDVYHLLHDTLSEIMFAKERGIPSGRKGREGRGRGQGLRIKEWGYDTFVENTFVESTFVERNIGRTFNFPVWREASRHACDKCAILPELIKRGRGRFRFLDQPPNGINEICIILVVSLSLEFILSLFFVRII